MSAKRSTWSSERIERLQRCFRAGLSCSQIAGEIGMSRNAVIGKMHRLGLSRPRDMAAAQVEQRRAARLSRPKTPAAFSSQTCPKRSSLNVADQHEVLMRAFPSSQPPLRTEDIPIHNGHGCTLLELGQGKCRWPISNPGAEEFRFCGNEPANGLPYCPGHARIAYRRAGRERGGARA